MLTFEVCNQSEETERRLAALMQENREILTLAQAGEACHADSLGWLDTKEWAGDAALAELEALAVEIRANADAFVLIGVGGSNNAARSVIEALQTDGGVEIIYAGNTLSPHAMNRMLRRLEGKSVYIDCIAKNFETLEPGASFRVLRQYMDRVYGDAAAGRIIATGTAGSTLERLCRDNGYTFLKFPTNIGGRYTAMSSVGLLPMAVAGADIRALVSGARDMQLTLRTRGPEENMAYRYACLRNLYYRGGYRMEMLSCFEPQFRYFYKWWIQLWAESEGKDGKGMFPVSGEFSEELHSVGQFIQDGTPMLFETFLTVREQQDSLVVKQDERADYFDYLEGKDFWEINQAALQATMRAHSKKLPCLKLEAERIDAYHFGQLFYFFQFACYVSCRIMGVNPFDQPGVEAYKRRMFEALGKETAGS